jgi:hypothetical protein
MKAFDHLCRFFIRFRYPITLPEDVAEALGIHLSNYITFDQFVDMLVSPSCKPTRLKKYMPREEAEEAFEKAHSKEQFKRSSLFSFYFSEGWIEFVLEYDEQSLLRRMYLQHKNIKQERGIEISLHHYTECAVFEPPLNFLSKSS